MIDLLARSKEILPWMVSLRREIHRNPEMGNHLPGTRDRVLKALDGLPLEITLHKTTSGIAAVLRGEKPGPTIILRGDMDALPLTEESGLDFTSTREGVMHACGHDLHVAMLSGAARLLSEIKDRLAGNVIFMFQPGEEGHFGAKHMLEEGLLETAGEPVTGAFALHVTTWFEAGTVNHRPGAQMASADEVMITITGKGGHASMPFAARDPVPVAAEIVLATQTAITRSINVFDPGLITFGSIYSGTTHNIIPETAHLYGTIRALSESTRTSLHELLHRVAPNVAAAHSQKATVEISPGYPVVINNPVYAEKVSGVAARLLGEEAARPMASPIMGGEDMAYVLNEVPGIMAFLGACPPDQTPGEAPSNHSNRVIYHEEVMSAGAALYAAVALTHQVS